MKDNAPKTIALIHVHVSERWHKITNLHYDFPPGQALDWLVEIEVELWR